MLETIDFVVMFAVAFLADVIAFILLASLPDRQHSDALQPHSAGLTPLAGEVRSGGPARPADTGPDELAEAKRRYYGN